MAVTSERKVGQPAWTSLFGAGELIDAAVKLKKAKTLAINIDLLSQEFGIYEKVDIYEVEYTYKVSRDSVYGYKSELLSVGEEVFTGNSEWRYTGLSTGFATIDIRGCFFNCSMFNTGVLGEGPSQ